MDVEQDDTKELYRTYIDQEMKNYEAAIQQHEKTIENINSVQKRLEDLPKKLEHKILAPVCSVGYFNAKIVRTNEVFVSLGDEYFVECTTFTAQKLLDRRKKILEEGMEDARSSIRMRQGKLDYFENLFKENSIFDRPREVEIREPYDEDAEKEYKRRRQERREQRLMSAKETAKVQKSIEKDVIDLVNVKTPSAEVMRAVVNSSIQAENPTSKENPNIKPSVEPVNNIQCTDHESVMKLLADLEKQEFLENELIEDSELQDSYENKSNCQDITENSVDDTTKSDDQKKKKSKSEQDAFEEHKRRILSLPGVKAEDFEKILEMLNINDSSDDDEEESEDELDSDDYSNSEDENIQKEPNEPKNPVQPAKIEVLQSTASQEKRSVRFAEQLEQCKVIDDIIISSDNSKKDSIQPVSILRSTAPTPVDRSAVVDADQQSQGYRSILPSSMSAFPGLVVERDPMSIAMADQLSREHQRMHEEELKAEKEKQQSVAGSQRVSKFKQGRLRN